MYLLYLLIPLFVVLPSCATSSFTKDPEKSICRTIDLLSIVPALELSGYTVSVLRDQSLQKLFVEFDNYSFEIFAVVGDDCNEYLTFGAVETLHLQRKTHEEN